MSLLTIGFVQIVGNWTGAYGETFVAWAPLIKRNRAKEIELGLIKP